MKSPQNYLNLLPKDGITLLVNEFYPSKEADVIYNNLLKETTWKQESVNIFGKWRLQPRLTAWYSQIDKVYKYSGLSLLPQPFTTLLNEIHHKLNSEFNLTFNSALINLYRDGSDGMGWHRDNEKVLGRHPTIASLSFGATRLFRLQHYQDKNYKVSIWLPPGSLLIMSGQTQEHWSHCLPKSKKVNDSRINITFRNLK